MNIEQIIEAVNGKLIGNVPTTEISGISSLDSATSSTLSFIVKQAYQKTAAESSACAIFVKEGWEIEGKAIIEVADPYLAYAVTALLFEDRSPLFGAQISQSAFIDSSASLAENVSVGPNATIGANVTIGAGTKIDANVVIEKNAVIGENCHLHSGAVIRYDVQCGSDVIIASNAVIGSEGFANAFYQGQFTRIPCFGTVILEDRVEIGSCTTIDRGNFENTIIKAGARIDNLVQVAHNVTVGESCGIAALCGFAGSTVIGNRVMIGGQTGTAGHLEIGDDVFIGAQSGVTSNLEGRNAYSGSPVNPMKEQRRIEMSWKKLPGLLREVRAIKKDIEVLKEDKNG